MIRRVLGRLRRSARAAGASIVPRLAVAATARNALNDAVVIAAELARTLVTRRRRALGARSPQPLRVGVDIRPFYEPLTGVGWYLFHLLNALASRSDIELVYFGEPLLTDQGPRLQAQLPGNALPRCFDFRNRQVSRFALPMARLAYPILALLERCDLFFGANYFLPRGLSAIARRRAVTIHDLTFRRFPEMLQAETLSNLQREMERELFRCDAAICVSEFTRADLLRYFNLAPEKAIAIHSGLEPFAPPAKTLLKGTLPDDFILFVSTIEPRKNLETLLTAFETLRETDAYQGDLVVVGRIGWKSEHVVQRMRESKWSKAILHLDYLDRDELAAVYGRCRVFVLPSHYEGFGFPLLEAMAAGAPSIAARSSSLPEIGGDAALYFDPKSAEQLVDRLTQLLHDEDLRWEMIEKGQQRAGGFLWERTAAGTAAVFRLAAR